MSRIWTAICINAIGNCNRRQFTASYDYAVARRDFNDMHPDDTLVALMPGIRTECETYDLKPEPHGEMKSTIDVFSLDGLSD